jgi:hypothetical protein
MALYACLINFGVAILIKLNSPRGVLRLLGLSWPTLAMFCLYFNPTFHRGIYWHVSIYDFSFKHTLYLKYCAVLLLWSQDDFEPPKIHLDLSDHLDSQRGDLLTSSILNACFALNDQKILEDLALLKIYYFQLN